MEIFPQVVLSGATGLVGSAVLQSLRGQGVSCVALVRDARHVDAVGPGSAIPWDPYHFQFREDMRRLNGVRAAIHLSGDNLSHGRWTKAKKQRILESRVRTTRSLVELLSRLDTPPEVLICASAVGFYGDRGAEILPESSTPGEGFLPQVCLAWEAAADEAAAFGIRVVHARFGVLLAANGGALAQMLPLFRAGVGGRLGNGRQYMSWMHLEDVARAMGHCLQHAEIAGPVNFVTPEPVTNAEFTRALAHQLRRPAVIPAPALALRLALGEMADAALLSSTRAVPMVLERHGFTYQHPELAGALADLLPR